VPNHRVECCQECGARRKEINRKGGKKNKLKRKKKEKKA